MARKLDVTFGEMYATVGTTNGVALLAVMQTAVWEMQRYLAATADKVEPAEKLDDFFVNGDKISCLPGAVVVEVKSRGNH